MIRGVFLPALALVAALGAGCAVNPITGKQELMLFSPDDDVALGSKYAPEVEKQLKGKIEDEQLQRYIDGVGQKIARVSHRPDIEYHFVAVNDDMTNAIALPGGYIYITKGLLEKLESEAQLAAILGHEAGHVVARDSMAAMSKQYGVALLLGALAVGDVSSDAMRAADITAKLLLLRYSRKDEKEADMAGLAYMVKAGYDPNGIVETMQILQKLQTERPIEFFSTHPNPENRLGYLRERIALMYSKTGSLKVGKEQYAAVVLAKLKKQGKAGSQQQ